MKYFFEGNIIDIYHRAVFPGRIVVESGRIIAIEKTRNTYHQYILPGFIDAHVHIESSMLTPGGFAMLAMRQGTVAAVSDPHEIANVLGMEGVNFMNEDALAVPFKFYFGAPSCVPATLMETAGAEISANDVFELLKRNEIRYLAEMMNFPGVINNDLQVLEKIKYASSLNKPVDGHAPGLSGVALDAYVRAGISTDHECIDLDEAVEKINKGMIIQIRNGSAAKNFEALYSLIDRYPDKVMLCSDDIHPDDLKQGHINKLVSRGLEKGIDLFNMLNAAIRNPILHYKLDVGMVQVGDPADFIVTDKLEEIHIRETVVNGISAFRENKIQWRYARPQPINQFHARPIRHEDIQITDQGTPMRIIKAFDGELFTKCILEWPKVENGNVIQDATRDIMKLVVLNRYRPSQPAIGFIKGFGMKEGAVGSSIAHDSHNIIAIGADDMDIIKVVNEIIKMKGGLAVSRKMDLKTLKLEIGGIISAAEPDHVIQTYRKLNDMAQSMCQKMKAPFMTLSFMALLVIPELKLSDRGLFDVNAFEMVPLFKT